MGRRPSLNSNANSDASAEPARSPGDTSGALAERSRSHRWAAALLAFLSSRACLASAIVLAIVVRAIPLALSLGHPGRLETADSADYLYLSDHLDAAYGGDEGTAASDLGLIRTGYPLVLRGIWELAGHHPHVVGLVQIVFACVALLALHRSATLLDSPAAGGIAALLVAVDPTAAIFSDLVLSEATYMLMIALTILAFVRVAQQPTLGRAAVLGGVLGASVLVRPVSQYLIVILAVALVLAVRNARVARASVAWILVLFLAAAAVVPGGWALRNRSETGVLLVSTVDSYTLLYFAAAPILASADGTDYATARAKLDADLADDVDPNANAAQRSRAEMRLAIKTIAAHPTASAKELVRSVATTSVGPSRQTVRDVISGDGAAAGPWELPVVAWAFVVVALTWIGAVLGLGVLIRERRWGMVIALAIPPCYLIAASLGQGYSRFRVPALPFLVVLAGVGGAQLLCTDSKRHAPAPHKA